MRDPGETATLPQLKIVDSFIDMGGGKIYPPDPSAPGVYTGPTSLSANFQQGDFSDGATEYTVFTQILIANGNNENLTNYLGSVTEFNFWGDGVTGVKVDKLGDATKENLGQYYVYVDGDDLKVSYIAGVAVAVPEPSTASLGLLAFSALLLRRRRA